MKSYKEPGFEERVSRAAEARMKALGALRARPLVDPDVLARGREAHEARQSANGSSRRQESRAVGFEASDDCRGRFEARARRATGWPDTG